MKTHILFIIDISGSMRPYYKETVAGFKKIVLDNKELKDPCDLSLLCFDHGLIWRLRGADLHTCHTDPESWLTPCGSTALYDAMCTGIDELGQSLAELKPEARPDKVLVITMTDGCDNMSKSKASDVKRRVEHQTQKYGWAFTFIGANQDAILTGADLGVTLGSSLTYSTSKTKETYRALSHMTKDYRTSGTLEAFSDAVRSAVA